MMPRYSFNTWPTPHQTANSLLGIFVRELMERVAGRDVHPFPLPDYQTAEAKLSKPDLLNQQLQLFAEEWPFLRYDSWLDCSSAHVFNEEDIATVRHVADSSAALRTQVAQIAQTSRTLNRRTKTAVALAFGH